MGIFLDIFIFIVLLNTALIKNIVILTQNYLCKKKDPLVEKIEREYMCYYSSPLISIFQANVLNL